MDYRLEQLRFEIREDPSSRNFFKLGEHLRREGELTEAVDVLRNGLEHHPRYVAAWVSLGRALLDSGDSLGASDALNNALELDPENSVAARAAGEAAINNSQWVAAVKALKRARGLAGQDDELDERIAFVEGKLAELGLLEGQKPPASAPKGDVFEAEPEPEIGSDPEIEIEFEEETPDEPFSVASAADSGVWDTTDDVFADESVEEADGPAEEAREAEPPPEWEMDSSDVLEPPPLPESVAEADDEEVFSAVGAETQAIPREDILAATEPFGDAAAVEAVDAPAEPEPEPEPEPDQDFAPVPEFEGEPEPDLDPFSFSETEPETETGTGSVDGIEIEPDPFAMSEAQTVPQPVYQPEPDPDPEPAPEFEPEPAPELEADPEPEPVFELEPEPEPETEPEPEPELPADELPMPTMTLARLAVEQEDLEMAEKTVRGVLEREPGNEDALRLLGEITGDASEDVPQIAAEDQSDPRVRALQRWLETVRLTSERLKT